MTINGHFALKAVSSSATNGLDFLDFGQNCFKNLQSYAYTISEENVAQGSYFLAR